MILNSNQKFSKQPLAIFWHKKTRMERFNEIYQTPSLGTPKDVLLHLNVYEYLDSEAEGRLRDFLL